MNQEIEKLLSVTSDRLTLSESLISSGARIDYAGFRQDAEALADELTIAMFPSFAVEHCELSFTKRRENALQAAARHLIDALAIVLPDEDSFPYLQHLFDLLPEIRRQLETDLFAAYQGDPAARSVDEVILSYPAFAAISAYRIAHELYLKHIPLIPRMITEYAHRRTGIDIHPGATIGDYFFIDHGTGVVIGETTTIGEHVKLYQHVTLGAKSFEVGDDGSLVKGIKRHPDIGNHVVIYAGATILGGKTQIGDHCVIGGNVWLTRSVAAGKTVLTRTAVTGDNTLLRDNVPHIAVISPMQRSFLDAML
ncbi:MAG: serine acetyltransferase [Lachnospiraceae bacterium]|nr:serine acetyltransferase [Lachnospiraceae bacterium]